MKTKEEIEDRMLEMIAELRSIDRNIYFEESKDLIIRISELEWILDE